MLANCYFRCIIHNARRRAAAGVRTQRALFGSDSKNDDDKQSPATSDSIETGLDITKPKSSTDQDDGVENAKRKLENLLSSMAIRSPDKVSETSSAINAKLAKPVRKKRFNVDPNAVHIDEVSPGLNERLVKAARKVVSTMGDGQFERSALFQILKAHDEETVAVKTGTPVNVDLSKIVDGMKVVKKEQLSVKPERERPRRHDYDGDEGHMQRPPPFEYRPRKRRTIDPDERLHIYRGESLGIFSKTTATGVDAVGPALDTWHRLQRQELKMMVTHPPTNGFEEMIRWTEQGKLWRYPIDNEQGLEREARVPFYEHVFLEHWLEGFPARGPVRQFMEIMLLGLSKNPYLTVERKRAYIDWFKAYFGEKQDLLRQTGAL